MGLRLYLIASVVAFVLVLGIGLGFLLRHVARQRAEEALQGRLAAVAAAAAAAIDGDAHERITSAQDPEFVAIRDHLRRVKQSAGLETELYTLAVVNPSRTRFVVMTNRTPYFGDTYVYRPEMVPVMQEGQVALTGVYEDEHGSWISAYAPIVAGDGRVVALLEVDETATTLNDLHVQEITSGVGLLAACLLLGVGLSFVLGTTISRRLADAARAVELAEQDLKELGSYRLVRRLGAGGMGEVWRAEHRVLKRPAAIKLIHEREQETPEDRATRVERFRREAHETARLRSQHTVELYDYGEAADGSLYYVMELLEGIDLEALIDRHGPLPPGRVVRVLAQACLSLGEAHDHGLIHRDVKPANIFLCRQGHELDVVKVLDFGLVLQREGDVQLDAKLTHAAAVIGTPAFFPPEATDPSRVDARADLYGLGCVGFWLLTGKYVFQFAGSTEAIIAHVTEEPVPPSQVAEGRSIPADLEAVIMDCLKKDPAERPQSALELRDRLLACAADDDWTEADERAWWDAHGDLEPQPQPADRPEREFLETKAHTGRGPSTRRLWQEREPRT